MRKPSNVCAIPTLRVYRLFDRVITWRAVYVRIYGRKGSREGCVFYTSYVNMQCAVVDVGMQCIAQQLLVGDLIAHSYKTEVVIEQNDEQLELCPGIYI